MVRRKERRERIPDREIPEADKAVITSVRKLLHHFRMEWVANGLEFVRDNRFYWLGSHWELGPDSIKRCEPDGKRIGLPVGAMPVLLSWAKQAREAAVRAREEGAKYSDDAGEDYPTEFDELVNSLLGRKRETETWEERKATIKKVFQPFRDKQGAEINNKE